MTQTLGVLGSAAISLLFVIAGAGCSGSQEPQGSGGSGDERRTGSEFVDDEQARTSAGDEQETAARFGGVELTESLEPGDQRGGQEDERDDEGAEREADLIPLPRSLREPVRTLEREVARTLDARDGDERVARIRPLTGREKAALEPDFRQPGPITVDHLVAIDVRFRRLDGSDGFGRLVVAEHFSHRALAGQRSPRRDYWKNLDRASDRRSVARDLAEYFRANYRADRPYPFDRVIPLHYFRELAEQQDIDIDELSMRHNNTYAFAIRKVRGTTSWSRHAIGALDINPLYNPIISRTRKGKRNRVDMRRPHPQALAAGHIRVEPLGSRPYAFTRKTLEDRRVIRDRNAAIVRYFVARGWMWGGTWRTMKDYHHFAPDRERR